MSRHGLNIPLITSPSGLLESQTRIADNLIGQLALMNHTNERAGDDEEGKQNRSDFWHWVPLVRQSRQFVEPYAHPQAVNPAIPEQRRAGRAVFIKPTLNRDITLAQFIYVDSKGQFVGTQDIRWTDGKTEEKVRAEAMEAWDRLECTRVGYYNRSLAACWARQRFLRSLLRAAGLDDDVLDMFPPEDFGLMQEMYTAKDALKKTYTSIQTSYNLMADTPIFGLESMYTV